MLAVGGSYLIFFRDGSSAEPVATAIQQRATQPAAQSPLVAQAMGTERSESTEGLPEAAPPTPDGTAVAAPVLIEKPATLAPEQVKPQVSEPRPAPVKPQAAQPRRQESRPVPKPAASESAAARSPRPEIKPTARPAASERSVETAPVATGTPPSASQATVTSKPEPRPAESTRATEPTPQEPTPAQVKPEPKPSTPQAEVAAPVSVAAAPVAQPTPQPVVPAATPVKLVNRTEPAYPSKSLKRARGGKIVLKLLINENGRVSRVLVDQGSPHKDLEAAAVGAVLSWRYEPATEGGLPVEAWTTAAFDL